MSKRVVLGRGITMQFCGRTMSTSDNRLRYQVLYFSDVAQKIVGTYEPGITKEDIRRAVGSSIGGRFEHFGDGHFSYINYLDDV